MELITRLIKENAKSIAVPITAVNVAILRWVSTNAGVEFIVNNEALTNTISVAIIAGVVWWTRNQKRKEPVPEILEDRGQSAVQILYVVAIILIIIVAFVWLSKNM